MITSENVKTYLEHVLLALLGGVGDLAVVEDDGVAVSTALGVRPADALGELGLGVGEEELDITLESGDGRNQFVGKSVCVQCRRP